MKRKKHNSWLIRNLKYISILFLLFVLIAPYLFTQYQLLPGLDFENTGQIGDTIGGITSPIINVFAALLVYAAFKAQVRANEIQVESLESEKKNRIIEQTFNTTLAELNWCSESYNNISYGKHFGIRALLQIIDELTASFEVNDSDIIILYQKILGLRNYLQKMVVIIDNIDSKLYQAILSNKLLFIYRSQTKEFKSIISRDANLFVNVIGKEKSDIISSVGFDDYTIDQLEKYKFNFHTKNFIDKNNK
jgi:hypothetical protein